MSLIQIPNVFCGYCRRMLSISYDPVRDMYVASHGQGPVACGNDLKVWNVETKLNAQEISLEEIKVVPVLNAAKRKIRS